MDKQDYMKSMKQHGFSVLFAEFFWKGKPADMNLEKIEPEAFEWAIDIMAPKLRKTQVTLEEELAKHN